MHRVDRAPVHLARGPARLLPLQISPLSHLAICPSAAYKDAAHGQRLALAGISYENPRGGERSLSLSLPHTRAPQPTQPPPHDCSCLCITLSSAGVSNGGGGGDRGFHGGENGGAGAQAGCGSRTGGGGATAAQEGRGGAVAAYGRHRDADGGSRRRDQRCCACSGERDPCTLGRSAQLACCYFLFLSAFVLADSVQRGLAAGFCFGQLCLASD